MLGEKLAAISATNKKDKQDKQFAQLVKERGLEEAEIEMQKREKVRLQEEKDKKRTSLKRKLNESKMFEKYNGKQIR